MRSCFFLVVIAMLVAAGCGSESDSKPAQPAASAPPPAARRPPPLPPVVANNPPSGPTTPAPPPSEPANVVREKAVVGVGKKGQGYGGGLVTTPIAVYFKAPQMMVFNIQIPKAMNDFRGVNGYFPRSEKEFFEKIIKENEIHLPELPPGSRYVYDPKKAAQQQAYDTADPPLLVERPE